MMESQERKVDVPLEWVDFIHTLEKLKKMKVTHRNKNWFKINPLDTFLLACDSLSKNDDAFIMAGNVKIGLTNITPMMCNKVRILETTLNLLKDLMKNEYISNFQQKRMKEYLQDIYTTSKAISFRYHFWLSSILYKRKDTEFFKTEYVDENFDQIFHCHLNDTSKLMLNLLIQEYGLKKLKNFWDFFKVLDIIEKLKKTSEDIHGCIFYLLFVSEIMLHTYNYTGNEEALEGADSNKLIEAMQVQIVSFLHQCMCTFKQPTGVPAKYFLLIITLAQKDISEMFINNIKLAMEVFFIHAEEKDAGIMVGLIEFLISGLEMNVSYNQVLNADLTNLLATSFDTFSGDLQCLVLKYGSVAYRSSHKKTLLTKCLLYIKSCHDLFKSNTFININNIQIMKRLEAVTCSLYVIDDIFSNMWGTNKSDYTHTHFTTDLPVTLPTDAIGFEPDLLENDDATFTDLKKQLLYQLINLAYNMVTLDENIEYTFAYILPQLFQPSYLPTVSSGYSKWFPANKLKIPQSVMLWKVDKKEFALKLLKFCNDCLEIDNILPFQICGVVVPKLIKNLDRTKLKDNEKMRILLDVIERYAENVNSSSNCLNVLLSHGFDLMLLLLPVNSALAKIQSAITDIYTSICKTSTTSTSLLFLKIICEFFLKNFPEEEEGEIKLLVLNHLKKHNRNDIRSIYLICKPWWKDEIFTKFRKYLYEHGKTGKMKSKQLQHMVEILILAASVKAKFCEESAVNDFTQPILEELYCSLIANNFTSSVQNKLKNQLSCVLLYEMLFPDKLQLFLNGKCSHAELENCMPKSILLDETQIDLLSNISKRINGMQTPRYEHLKTYLLKIMRSYISKVKIHTEGIHEITNEFEKQLLLEQNNVEKIESLQKHGYSESLWTELIDIEVETSGLLNMDENLIQTLLLLYNEYVILLRNIGVSHVTIETSNIKTDEIFTDQHPLVELKSRRIAVNKLLDQNALKQSAILEKKLDLLLREEKIEQEAETLAIQPLKKHKFNVKLNVKYFDCARCCGAQIIGCYSLNGGEHCERPLEIGFRADSAFASIYDEKGTEIENCELIFTDQGVYVYKSYTSGHPYDTSEVWLMFFGELLDVKELVPAIILPHNYPNAKTWLLVRQWVSPDITGTVISCDFDFSPDWRSYYDSRPESFGHGKDLFLTKGFREQNRKTSFSFHRQLSVSNNKDLAGTVFQYAMQNLLDGNFKQFRFLGKTFAVAITNFIETGIFDKNYLSDHFQYDRWRKESIYSKEEIISQLSTYLIEQVNNFIKNLDLHWLIINQLKQFLKLRCFVLNNLKQKNADVLEVSKKVKIDIDEILQSRLRLFEISSFHEAFQETLMRWIFENEDRVWRYRGGRDSVETYSQFIGFLEHKQVNRKICFPGLVYCIDRHNTLTSPSLVQLKDVVSYAVGEYRMSDESAEGDAENLQVNHQLFKDDDVYEIVTAWVDTRYRGLQLSTNMYLKIFLSTSSKYILFDILENRISKVIQSSFILDKLDKFGFSKLLFTSHSKSYNVVTATENEQFEKVLIHRQRISMLIEGYEMMRSNSFLLTAMVFVAISSIFTHLLFKL